MRRGAPELSAEQANELEVGNCPDCGRSIFRPGPRGGLSQNIECVRCGSRFNVALYSDNGIRSLIFAQRIPSEAEGGGVWREDLFPRVLQ
jgi:hypothetical protein